MRSQVISAFNIYPDIVDSWVVIFLVRRLFDAKAILV